MSGILTWLAKELILMPTTTSKMNPVERRAVFSLSFIMSLRMIGLFMVLPVFSLYAHQLTGATPVLMGLAMGIYGLSQALFQIPFGVLSDHFGRKPIILSGLLIFILGSFLSAQADSIYWLIIGRALQGLGAVGSTILAFMADFTREEQRTKSMAIAGVSIGLSFSLAMIIGPLLMKWISINELFILAMLFGVAAIFILYMGVPAAPTLRWHRDTEPELNSFFKLLRSSELIKLDLGIFILHAIFTASFIGIPIGLDRFTGLSANTQWYLYLPSLMVAAILSLCSISMIERKHMIRPFFLISISTLAIAECFLWWFPHKMILMFFGACLFFTAFSILEAFLPSMISRTAPPARKGSALGIFSCSQFLGIFIGGMMGGWLYGKFNLSGVYLFCILLSLLWLILAYFMQTPRYLQTQMWTILAHQQAQWAQIARQLQMIPGIVEITFIAEEGTAYLKMEKETIKNPDFIRLKEHLQLTNL